MKHNPDTTKKRLSGVPYKDRVFVYNASIIIEFLNRTFMPLPYFVPVEKIAAKNGKPLGKLDLLMGPYDEKEHRGPMKDLYDLYLLYRQQAPYSSPVESRFQFSIIVRRMLYLKNGWQFMVRRTSRSQVVTVAPLLIRSQAPVESQRAFPAPATNVVAGQVEAPAIDEPEIPEEEGRWVEVDTPVPDELDE